MVEFHFSWIFSPISFLWNTGLRGWGLLLPLGVCHALRWALAQRGDAECSAKAERDPHLDIDAVLSGKWQEPLLCPRGWAAFRAEEPLSFPSLHQSALGCPTSELRCTFNLRCTLTVPLTHGRSFTWCPAVCGCCRAENFCRGQTTGLPAFLPAFHLHISVVYMFCLKILAFLIFASSLDLDPGESALIFKTFQSFYWYILASLLQRETNNQKMSYWLWPFP